MLKSTFTAFFRSFTRHPLYALLNLLGLSLGIAVFITLALFVRFETTYEKWLPHYQSLYEVETAWIFPGSQDTRPGAATSGSLFDDLRTDNPGIVGTRLLNHDLTVHQGAQASRESIVLVDNDFFKVFDLPLAAGDRETALRTPGDVILTEAMAAKYFPGQRPQSVIGKTLNLTDDQGTADYRVSAVAKTLPNNTDQQFDFIRLLTPAYTDTVGNWKHYGSQRLQTVLRIDNPAEAARLNSGFRDFANRHAANQFGTDKPDTVFRLSADPLTGIHLADDKARNSIYALGLVGVLAFLIAAINYINLATARAGMRAKEVAVRKTLGATQGDLRTQFLCEAVLVTLLAMLIGLSLVEVGLPLINSFGALHLKLDYVGEAVPLALAGGFILLVGLLAGLYPAFVLAGFRPAQVLASSRTPAGGRWAIRTREGLVVLQFTVVVAFFIMVMGFFAQLQHMKTSDLGFRRDGLLITSSTYDAALSNGQRDAIWSAFRALPGVTDLTVSYSAPGDSSLSNGTSISRAGFVGHKPSLNWIIVGPDYFSTYGARTIAGRLFDRARGEDVAITWKGDQSFQQPDRAIASVVLNEAAVSTLGFKSPQDAVGQLLDEDGDPDRTLRVIGVVANIRFRSPKDKVPPTFYVFDLTPYDHAITGLRYSGVSDQAMRDRMLAAWRTIAPDVPFKAVSAVDNIDEYYKPDRNRSNLFSVGAGVAALIGCIGLYGMAAFNTSRRSREIGLRKVLGASAGNVTGLLVGQFLRPVVIANLLAWPIAWYGLKQWLSQFDDAVAISPLYFAAATAFAVAIALVTVGGLAMASASTEPGKALRHD